MYTILSDILAQPETLDLLRNVGRVIDPQLRRSIFMPPGDDGDTQT